MWDEEVHALSSVAKGAPWYLFGILLVILVMRLQQYHWLAHQINSQLKLLLSRLSGNAVT